MKTIAVEPTLLTSAEVAASECGTTVDALVAESLQRFVSEHRSVDLASHELQAHFRAKTWGAIKDCVYGPFDD
jgi:hypothetical protein